MTSVEDPAALADLFERLSRVQPQAVRRWGSMSAAEMLCHLGDAAVSVLARPGGPPVANHPLRKWLGLYAPLPWPHTLTTPRSVDPRLDGTRPSDFDADRARAIAGLRGLAAASVEALPVAHGYFGAMSARDWKRWAYRHTEHHLRQFGL